MTNSVNIAKLFEKANAYKVDLTEDAQLVGGKRILTPILPKDVFFGVIKEITTRPDNSYIQLIIEIEHNNKVHFLKKTLFWSAFSNSEYVLTLAMLLENEEDSFNPRKPFNKNLLIGKVVRVEIGHKKVENGEISEITKVIEEIKPIVDHMAI